MHRFKKGDVVMVGEKGPAPWSGNWPCGDVGVVAGTNPDSRLPLTLHLGPESRVFLPYFTPEELHYIGRL